MMHRDRSSFRPVLSLVLAGLVCACGGGGGDDDDPPFVPMDDVADTDAPVTDAVAPPPLSTGTPFDTEGSSVYAGAINSARLQGPVIGSGERSNDEVARSVPFEVDSSEDGMVVRDVIVSSLVAGVVPSVYVLAVIENTSDEFLCDVQVQGLEYVDAAGAPFPNEPPIDLFASGAIGEFQFADISTCVPPGATVFTDTDLGRPFEAETIASVRIASVGQVNEDFTAVANAVEPVSYDVLPSGAPSVMIANRGSVPVLVSGIDLFLLDDRGMPVSARSLGDPGADALEPGEERVIEPFVFVRFEGQSSSIRAVVKYINVDD